MIQRLLLVARYAGLMVITVAACKGYTSQIYINVGEAKTKKSTLALPFLNYLGSSKANATATANGAELYNVIKNDLTVSSLFQMMSQAAFLENTSETSLRPAPTDAKGFSFEKWKTIGTDFLIRGGYTILGSDIELEAYLYFVPKGELIFGKKYRGPISAIRRVAHSFSNDVLKQLTDTKTGPFLSKLVVASDRGGGNFREIYVMDWDGFNPTQVTSHRTIAMSPAWSPDAKKIAYTAFVMRGKTRRRNADLFLFDVESGKRNLISYRQGFNSGANFMPDNQHILLTISQGKNPNIYKMKYDGSLVGQLTKGPLGAMNVEPAASPDGNRIAFSSDRSRNPMIYVMNSNGSNQKRVTFAGVFNSTPSWSPDGQRLAFAGQASGHFDIFTMNADGSGVKRLTSAKKSNGKWANNEDPSFSPDGRYIMFTSNRSGKSQIYVTNLDGSEEFRITNDNHNYYRPKWSPNME